jgi:hypothetical protein
VEGVYHTCRVGLRPVFDYAHITRIVRRELDRLIPIESRRGGADDIAVRIPFRGDRGACNRINLGGEGVFSSRPLATPIRRESGASTNLAAVTVADISLGIGSAISWLPI